MQKIVILSKTKYLEEALNSSNFFKGNKVETSLKLQGKIDLVIVDGELPDMKVNSKVQQIKISQYHGADLTKPIKLVDLINIMRTKLGSKGDIIKFAGIVFDKKKKQVRSEAGNTITLTTKEAQILEYLLKKTNSESTSEQILRDVWGISKKLKTRTIETHIYSLRKKLSRLSDVDLIQTRGNGYGLKII